MTNTMEVQKLLEQLGFSEKEALVYLIVLELNEAVPSAIARKANLKRPTAYFILEHLREKGLVSNVKKKGSLFYRATKPETFIENQEHQLKNNQLALETLSKKLPELVALHAKYSTTPQMSVFYGKEGLIQVMEDSLTAKTELLCWGHVEEGINSPALKEYYPKYIKKKVKNGLWLKGIFSYDKDALRLKKNGKKELREVYLIPKDEFPFENEINIYDDKILIISHADEIGIIIENERMANTQRSIFKLAFEVAKEWEKKILTKEDQIYLKNQPPRD